jgi:hypothetical protein
MSYRAVIIIEPENVTAVEQMLRHCTQDMLELDRNSDAGFGFRVRGDDAGLSVAPGRLFATLDGLVSSIVISRVRAGPFARSAAN